MHSAQASRHSNSTPRCGASTPPPLPALRAPGEKAGQGGVELWADLRCRGALKRRLNRGGLPLLPPPSGGYETVSLWQLQDTPISCEDGLPKAVKVQTA